MRRHAPLATSLGDLLAVGESLDGEDALIGLYFPGHWHPPADDAIGHPTTAEDPLFTATRAELAAYLTGERTAFTIPTRTHGDPFAERVWGALTAIPYGHTTTYGALAADLGNRDWARRAGQAVGRNPISIIIPCHRVVGADGSLTGYAGGLDRKRTLLTLEAARHAGAGRLF